MKRFIAYFLLMIGVGLPAPAQDAGSMQLAPGMSAVTLRVMIESSDLGEIKAGDRVDLFQALLTGWDYRHIDEFTDSYILKTTVEDVLVLGIMLPSRTQDTVPVHEAQIRLEVSARFFASYRWVVNVSGGSLGNMRNYITPTLIIDQAGGDLPVFCPTCESISRLDFFDRDNPPKCYRRERRGTELTQIVTPCRDD